MSMFVCEARTASRYNRALAKGVTTRFVLIGINALLARSRDMKRVAALQMRAGQARRAGPRWKRVVDNLISLLS